MSKQSRTARGANVDGERPIRRVLLLSGLWTIAVWISRLRLIEDGATVWAHSRIYVSMAFGLGLLALTVARRPLVHRTAVVFMLMYGIWMVVAWVPSLINVLGSSRSASFQIVHTALAVGSLGSGALVASVARRLALYPPMTTSTHTAAKSAAR